MLGGSSGDMGFVSSNNMIVGCVWNGVFFFPIIYGSFKRDITNYLFGYFISDRQPKCLDWSIGLKHWIEPLDWTIDDRVLFSNLLESSKRKHMISNASTNLNLENIISSHSSGWWFGCHFLHFPINIGLLIIPIDELIFFRGVAKNHQPESSHSCMWRDFFYVPSPSSTVVPCPILAPHLKTSKLLKIRGSNRVYDMVITSLVRRDYKPTKSASFLLAIAPHISTSYFPVEVWAHRDAKLHSSWVILLGQS